MEYLAGNLFGFVYADYGVRREAVFHQLTTFVGYVPIYVRDVAQEELAPNGWSPASRVAIRQRENFGIPGLAFFAFWAVMERSPDFSAHHGPSRFSLLYIGYDGIATYRSIYSCNKIAPEILAVVHPGGFGGNYTDFEDEGQELARTVLADPERIPPYLLNDWRGGEKEAEHSWWPRAYPRRISVLPGGLRLWGRLD